MMGMIRALLAPEQRSGLKASSDWHLWERFFPGVRSSAGIDITPDTALRISTVFACCRVIAEDIAKTPLNLMQRVNNTRRVAPERSLHTVLHSIANPEQTSQEMRETITGHLALRGNGFVVPERVNGEVVAGWPWRPDRVTLVRETATNKLWYVLTLPNGQQRKLRYDEIMHIRGVGYDGLMGWSPISLGCDSLGIAAAVEAHAAAFYRNSARPDIYLLHPGELGEDAYNRLKKEWASVHQGVDRAHKVAVLEEGMKIEEVGFNAEDARLVEMRSSTVTDVCRWFRVPPHKVGYLEKANYNTLEQQNLEHLGDCLLPYYVRWEQRIAMSLLTEYDRERGYYVKHNVDAVLRSDTKSRAEYLKVLRELGVYHVDRILELLDEDPVGGPGGQERIRPMNFVPIGTPAPVSASPGQRSEAWAPLLRAAYLRSLRRFAEAGADEARLDSARSYADEQIGPVIEAAAAADVTFTHDPRSILARSLASGVCSNGGDLTAAADLAAAAALGG